MKNIAINNAIILAAIIPIKKYFFFMAPFLHYFLRIPTDSTFQIQMVIIIYPNLHMPLSTYWANYWRISIIEVIRR